jgi:hypothetical protein
MNGTKVAAKTASGSIRRRCAGAPALAAGRSGMGGKHEGPEPNTDLFMAVVVFALIALLAIVIILALRNP